MINDDLKLTGSLIVAINDEVVQEADNVVVTAGKDWVAERMRGDNSAMSHMAVGTGSNAVVAGDTTLQTEVARGELNSTTVSGMEIIYTEIFEAGTPEASTAVTEAGIFNDYSGGDMLARTVFSVVNKGTLDSMTITWTITVL